MAIGAPERLLMVASSSLGQVMIVPLHRGFVEPRDLALHVTSFGDVQRDGDESSDLERLGGGNGYVTGKVPVSSSNNDR